MDGADAWTLVFDGWDPADEGRREALCTLGNGRFATRGATAESVADGVSYPGTYAAGCYNRLGDELADQVVETESLVNLPNWLVLRFAVLDDGREDPSWFDLAHGPEVRQRVQLDVRRGLLIRTLRFTDRAGRTTSVRQRRFVHMACGQLAGLHTVFTAENWSGRLLVESGIDGTVTNAGVARYAGMAATHLDVVQSTETEPTTVLLVARTSQSELRIAEAARTVVVCGDERDEVPRRCRRQPGRVTHELELAVRAGEPVAVEKVVAVVTSRDVGISEPGATATELLARAPSFDELLQSHELAWHQLWRRFRLQLRTGHGSATVDTLRTLRLSVFHLLQSVSPHNIDLDAGLPARGLHGEAYRGHVFWDELFVLPVLTLRLPGLARALLRYRTRRLDAARRAARAAGFTGAMYPWQSGSDGREESQRVHLNPMSGRWLPDTSHLQRHVGLAVAYNIWQYYQATDDLEFRADHGAETILEIARFFAGLAGYDSALDRFRIRGVMGPDEYSTRYPGAAEPGIDDNAYTNVMTVWLLLRAQDVLDVLAYRAAGEARPGPDRTAALARHQPTHLRADRARRGDQPVRGLPRSRRAGLGRLPPPLRRHPAAGPDPGGRGPFGRRLPGGQAGRRADAVLPAVRRRAARTARASRLRAAA